MKTLTATLMRQALARLDELVLEDGKFNTEIKLIVGGGGAMILAHGFTLATTDIDAVPVGTDVSSLEPLVKKIAHELQLPVDWLNPYFYTFAHTLPSDYGSRLVEVFRGKKLKVVALGKEEMLIMKCFAHRQKDVGHAKALLKSGADAKKVEAHIESLRDKRLPGAQHALDFLDDLMDQI